MKRNVSQNGYFSGILCKKVSTLTFAAVISCALINFSTTPAMADNNYPTTLESVKADITTYMSGLHDTYTVSDTETDGALKLSFYDKTTNTNITYYVTPSDTDREALSKVLATGNAFLREAQESDTVVFVINGTNYTYDISLVPESRFVLTPTNETTGDNVFLIPEYNAETQTTTDKYYKLTYKL